MLKGKTTILAGLLAITAVFIAGCSKNGADVAATVNGKAITKESIEKILKQQAQGQNISQSPLQIHADRLQVLNSLIQREVLLQKAEKEGVMPSDQEVLTEVNKRKTASGLSTDDFSKGLAAIGQTEDDFREGIKADLAIGKLQEKVIGKIDAPSSREVEEFFNSNPEQFKNKRGAFLGAIVVNPALANESGAVRSQVEVAQKLNDVIQKLNKGAEFSAVAYESSEEQNTRSSGGQFRYFTAQELAQYFGSEVADTIMTKLSQGDKYPRPVSFQGSLMVLKVLQKFEKDEDRTLESPNVRQEIIEYLTSARKELLWSSYTTVALNEAKIDNFLAKDVIARPNELSGARPAPAPTAAAASPAPSVEAAKPAEAKPEKK